MATHWAHKPLNMHPNTALNLTHKIKIEAITPADCRSHT